MTRPKHTQMGRQVLREIASKNIPSKLSSGKPVNPEYDKLYARILELKNGKVLPVECENIHSLSIERKR